MTDDTGSDSQEQRVAQEIDWPTWTRRGLLGTAVMAGLGGTAAARSESGGKGGAVYNWKQDVDANKHALTNLGAVETADNPVSIRDFEGANLSVDESGVLNSEELLKDHMRGDILLIAPGLDGETIDPTEHDRPVQMAVDAVQGGVNQGGTVLLPPNTEIEEADTIMMKEGVSVRGYGMQTTTIKTIKPDVPGINLSSADFSTLDGFKLKGVWNRKQSDSPTTGPAIILDRESHPVNDGMAHDVHIGRLALVRWSGGAFQTKGNDITNIFWGSRIDHLWLATAGTDDHNAQMELFGLAVQIGGIHSYPRISNEKPPDVLRVGGNANLVGWMNIGFQAGRAINHTGGTFQVGSFNYEPTYRPTPREVVSTRGGPAWFGPWYPNPAGLDTLPDDYFAENAYRIGEGANGLVLSDPGGANFGGNTVRVTGEPARACYYLGPQTDVVNESGSYKGLIRTLATAGTAADKIPSPSFETEQGEVFMRNRGGRYRDTANLTRVKFTHTGGAALSVSQTDVKVNGNRPAWGIDEDLGCYYRDTACSDPEEIANLAVEPVPDHRKVLETERTTAIEPGDTIDVIAKGGPDDESVSARGEALRDRNNGDAFNNYELRLSDDEEVGFIQEIRTDALRTNADGLKSGDKITIEWTPTPGAKTRTLFSYTVQ